ncbi:MAG: PQQ-binding-like beta-propeller repeat protein [Acidobacteria bacterium]|nr:PQQ-binding-like beta-propeller repeat protein [Acidobacteriota bacterium]
MNGYMLIAFFLLCVAPALSQVNVLTANYGNRRTNANLNETILNTANVNPRSFGKLFSLPVDGQIYAQPLYVQNVDMAGKGVHNVVYVATMRNTVYAFDADAPGGSLWRVNVGPPVPSSDYNFDDILPDVGILSTPVIDLNTKTIYLVANTVENGKYFYRLHALDIRTGQEKFGGPAEIQASVPGTSIDSQDGVLTFNAFQHLQRPGLLLVNNTVYIAFGSHADTAPFHGWLLGYNAANVQQQVYAFTTTPNTGGGSIWQSGHGPAADEQGNIYVVTGNGYYDGSSEWGETFLRLTAGAGLTVADWFTPDNWTNLNDVDNDLGSCGPVLAGGGFILSAAKDGKIYLVDRGGMGHFQPGNGQIVQSFMAASAGWIFNLAYWEYANGPIVYIRGFNDTLKAFRMTSGRLETTPFSQISTGGGLPFDGMALSASGNAADSGILWLTTFVSGDRSGKGILRAYAAADISKELWNSEMNGVRDSYGNLAKFAAPTVANGKVYVPTASRQLVVYGLRPLIRQISAVLNAASGSVGSVAPGELVTIYGTGLGPAQPTGAAVNSSMRLSTRVAGTRIFFDDQAAPILYTSSDRVVAVVPYVVAGQGGTEVTAEFQKRLATPVFLSVADTAPGLFTMDESGQGPGAILNEDGSLNSPSNPAARGSVVVLYGTGEGQTDPSRHEHELATHPLPKPLHPVSVLIDGQEAEVLYAGAAPGFTALIQVNARVPAGVTPGSAVPVVVKIGGASSQGGVTLAVQ